MPFAFVIIPISRGTAAEGISHPVGRIIGKGSAGIKAGKSACAPSEKGGPQRAPPSAQLNSRFYIMPPMPPPGGIAGMEGVSSGLSEMMHSVVSISPATLAAFCSA